MWSNISSPITTYLRSLHSDKKLRSQGSSNLPDEDNRSAGDGDSSGRRQWSQSQSSNGSSQENNPQKAQDNPGSPLTRYKHAVCTTSTGYIYIYGGRYGNLPLDDDLWRFDPHQNTWIQIETSGSKPPSLQEHTLVEYNEQLYLFGGQVSAAKSSESFWRLDLVNNEWYPLNMKSSKYGAYLGPTNRRGHSSVIYGDSMFVFGGFEDLKGSSAQLWEYNLICERWELRNLSSTSACHPEPRHGHSAVIYRDSMYIYGGLSNLKPLNDLWRWSWRDKRWYKVRTKGKSPGHLHGHSAILAFDSMFIFGGERNGRSTRALWRLNFANLVWQKIRPKGPQPNPMTWHGAVANPLSILDESNYIVEGDTDMSPLKGDMSCTINKVELNPGGSAMKTDNEDCRVSKIFHSKSISNCTSTSLVQPDLNQTTQVKKLKKLNMKFLRRHRAQPSNKNAKSTPMKPPHIKSSASDSGFAARLSADSSLTNRQANSNQVKHEPQIEARDKEQNNGKILDELDSDIKEMFQNALTNSDGSSIETGAKKSDATIHQDVMIDDLDASDSITSDSRYRTANVILDSSASNRTSFNMRSQRTSHNYATPPSEMNNHGASISTLTSQNQYKVPIITNSSNDRRNTRPKSEIVQSLIDRADDRIKHLFTPFFNRPERPYSSRAPMTGQVGEEIHSRGHHNRPNSSKRLSHRHSFTDKSKRHTIHQTMTYYNLYFSEDKYSPPSDESSQDKSSDLQSQDDEQMDCSNDSDDKATPTPAIRHNLTSSRIRRLDSTSGALIGVRGISRADRESLESSSRTLCEDNEVAGNTNPNSINGFSSHGASSQSHALTSRHDFPDDNLISSRNNHAECESCDNTSLSFSVIAEFEEDDILQFSSPTDPVLKQRSPRRDTVIMQVDQRDTFERGTSSQALTNARQIAHKSGSSGYESSLDQSNRNDISLRQPSQVGMATHTPTEAQASSSLGKESSIGFAQTTDTSLDNSAMRQIEFSVEQQDQRSDLEKAGNSSTTVESLALNSDIDFDTYNQIEIEHRKLDQQTSTIKQVTRLSDLNPLQQISSTQNPIRPVQQLKKRSLFGKKRSKNRYWQLCMFVIGGKQAGSQNGTNEPITIWRLYI